MGLGPNQVLGRFTDGTSTKVLAPSPMPTLTHSGARTRSVTSSSSGTESRASGRTTSDRGGKMGNNTRRSVVRDTAKLVISKPGDQGPAA